jgi:predicted dehydrogenase
MGGQNVKVGIIGCGMIGRKRAAALDGCSLVACADPVLERAELLKRGHPDCTATTDWRVVVSRTDIDAIIIATPHDSLASIAYESAQHGKHLLVEKPAARTADELRPVQRIAEERNLVVRVGFNHRYHRAFQQARKIVDSGALGPLMFLRARYGHGGRPGYDKEWRAVPAISGGGELIDQGVHVIDLARWFLGDFSDISGHAHTYFWDMPVDDNAFLLLKTPAKQVAFLHASCTEWKNTFSFEIYGRDGKLHIDGLGGSYGLERLAWYKMTPSMGPPETSIWEYPMADNSWAVEMAEFVEDIRLGREPSAGLADAIAALEIVTRIYQESGYDHRA